jgi:hypothetical protein
MANRAGKKLIKNVAKTMGKGAAEKNSFTPNQLAGVIKTGTSMGVRSKSMSKAVVKGVKQGNKAKKSGK